MITIMVLKVKCPVSLSLHNVQKVKISAFKTKLWATDESKSGVTLANVDSDQQSAQFHFSVLLKAEKTNLTPLNFDMMNDELLCCFWASYCKTGSFFNVDLQNKNKIVWPVSSNLHVSCHLFNEQRLVLLTLLIHLSLEISLMLLYFIYSTLNNMHTPRHAHTWWDEQRRMRFRRKISSDQWINQKDPSFTSNSSTSSSYAAVLVSTSSSSSQLHFSSSESSFCSSEICRKTK